MILPTTAPQIVVGAKSSTAAPFIFQIMALFCGLKILGYLYFEGYVKMVLKNVIFGAKILAGMLLKLVRPFLNGCIGLFQGF